MDVIKLLNCTIDITVTAGGALVESKNIDDFYEMSIAGVNTVTIDPKFSAALRNPLYTYTCHGGATVARVSRIDILSKEWNFYLPEARSIYLSQIDFIIKRTSAGKITIDYFPSTSNISMIDAAKASKSSLGTNILETGAYADLPFEATFKRLSHRIYFQAEGTCVQIRIFLNDEQMVVSATAECDFQLEGMIISASRTSDFE